MSRMSILEDLEYTLFILNEETEIKRFQRTKIHLMLEYLENKNEMNKSEKD